MANDYFRFKQFTVRQNRCGMKVGTDGTLLGAWAHGGKNILDVGTGTGLIAMMMAQRFPMAQITGIDIDCNACCQAQENIALSPFQIEIQCVNITDMRGLFDCIVSNPPYFVDSLPNPDHQEAMARHTSSLSYSDLLSHSYRLLTEDGELSLIIPTEGKKLMESEAALNGFFKVRECAVKTTPQKSARRYLLAFRKHFVGEPEMSEGVLQDTPNVRSSWYQQLTKDFYL